MLLTAALSFWSLSCNSKVCSLTKPDTLVTRPELQLEIDSLIKLAEIRMTELDNQDAIKTQLLNFAALTTQTGTLNYTGLIPIAASILGLGAVADNARRRLKEKTANTEPKT